MSNKIHDICVVGGGAAGAMAVLRAVLNNDSCLFFPGTAQDKRRSRGFWVSRVENMPAHLNYKKGIENPNRESLDWLMTTPFKDKFDWRKNLGVTKIVKLENGLFEITDSKGDISLARYVVLCTGVMDVQPEIAGSIEPILPYANVQLAEYCLRCDGHHVFGKKTVVLGHTSGAAWVAIMLHERYQMPETTILTNGKKAEFDDEVSALIRKYNINVNEACIDDLHGDAFNNRLEGFMLQSGKFIEAEVCFVSLGMIVYNELARQLGCELDGRGFVIGDKSGETSIQNVFVAGDLRAQTKKQIYTAWDTAVDSLDAINMRLRRARREGTI
jgi:thioredoxin reductase (NADPH)